MRKLHELFRNLIFSETGIGNFQYILQNDSYFQQLSYKMLKWLIAKLDINELNKTKPNLLNHQNSTQFLKSALVSRHQPSPVECYYTFLRMTPLWKVWKREVAAFCTGARYRTEHFQGLIQIKCENDTYALIIQSNLKELYVIIVVKQIRRNLIFHYWAQKDSK